MVLFQTQALCKFYRAGSRAEVRALDEVSLDIERGSFTVVIGPSGSGKTTLLALLGALERPTRGAVLFEGKDLAPCSDVELARVRRRMGFVFQDFSLVPNLSAGENITYALIPRRVARAERRRCAAELLARFGLGGKLGARAGFSGIGGGIRPFPVTMWLGLRGPRGPSHAAFMVVHPKGPSLVYVMRRTLPSP